MKTPAYVQVTGHINQSLINLQADDTGGEMDPHGMRPAFTLSLPLLSMLITSLPSPNSLFPNPSQVPMGKPV